MISDQNLKEVKRIHRIGQILQVFPQNVAQVRKPRNPIPSLNYCLELKVCWEWYLSRLHAAFQIILKILCALIYSYMVIRGSTQPTDVIFVLNIIIIMLFSILVQAFYFVFYQEIMVAVNDCLRLIQKTRVIHGEKGPEYKDGYEPIILSFLLFSIICILAVGPSTVLLLTSDASFVAIFKEHIGGLLVTFQLTAYSLQFYLIFGAFISASVAFDCLFINLFLCHGILYFQATILSLSRLQYCRNFKMSESLKADLRILYRSHQLLHTFIMGLVGPVTPVTLSVGECLVIFPLFIAIRLSHELDPFASLALYSVAFMALLSFMTLLTQLHTATTNSANFSRVPLSAQRIERLYLSKYDKRFLKSCRPLYSKIGGTFTVTAETFPTIINDIVVENVISLLILF